MAEGVLESYTGAAFRKRRNRTAKHAHGADDIITVTQSVHCRAVHWFYESDAHEHKSRKRIMTTSVFASLPQLTRSRVHDAIEVVSNTGCASERSIGLKWDDVDLEKATAFVQRALQRVRGDDGKTALQFVEPKSEDSYRLLAIPASAVALLRRHRLRQNEERLLAGSRWQKTGVVLRGTIGTPLDERNVRREFYAFLQAAQFASDPCPRPAPQLRHDPAGRRRAPQGRAADAWPPIGASHPRPVQPLDAGTRTEGARRRTYRRGPGTVRKLRSELRSELRSNW